MTLLLLLKNRSSPQAGLNVGGRIVRGQFSRGQWRDFKERKRKEHEQRALEHNRKVGLALKQRDERVDAGAAAFEEMLRRMEAEAVAKATALAQLDTNDLAARLKAIAEFNRSALAAYQAAKVHQSNNDDLEE